MSTPATGFAPFDPGASNLGASSGDRLPAHQPTTYYDRPLLKKPHWEWEVIAYLFMGGVMGGSGILVALADEAGDDAELARVGRYVAFALAATCPIVLVKHLGRPERFLHMLRIVKFKSVMSMGVWGLIAFSLPASAAAARQGAEDGWLPDVLRFFAPQAIVKPALAVLGAFISGYTGVLLSATAIPAWSIGKRFIPALCVCSGISGACAANAGILALTGRGNAHTNEKLERLEIVASVSEFVLLLAFRRHARDYGKPMFEGPRGKKLRTWTMGLGIAAPLALNLVPVRARWKTVLASALTLAGGYVFRETLIEAGKLSSEDPRAAALQPE